MLENVPRPLFFYKSGSGNEPVKEWIKSLPKKNRKMIGADILTVQLTWPIGKPLVDSLGQGLWEIRTRLENVIARTIFCVIDGEMILLHGFIKKTRKTPPNEINLALKRKRQYEQENQ